MSLPGKWRPSMIWIRIFKERKNRLNHTQLNLSQLTTFRKSVCLVKIPFIIFKTIFMTVGVSSIIALRWRGPVVEVEKLTDQSIFASYMYFQLFNKLYFTYICTQVTVQFINALGRPLDLKCFVVAVAFSEKFCHSVCFFRLVFTKRPFQDLNSYSAGVWCLCLSIF